MKIKIVVNSRKKRANENVASCILYSPYPDYDYIHPCPSYNLCFTNNIALDVCPEFMPNPMTVIEDR